MADTLSKLKKTSPETLTSHDKDILKFLTCGSVDDGKSTLLGRLLFETDSIFENEVNTITNANGHIDYAHLVDGLESEREQGITIDVAYRYFQTNKRKFIAIDTPGHVQYTRNMATGASNASLAIIMIDASKGLLEQSKRHSIICSLLGIKHIIVCVNKMDLVNFCEKTFLSIKNQYSDFAKKLHFETTEFLPASALRGDNITKISEMMSWYKGKSLLQYLEEKDIDRNNLTQTARMPVQWVCRPNQDFRGYAGTLCQGKIHVNDTLLHLPSNQHVNISAIHLGEKSLTSAQKGQAIMVELDKEIDITRGDVLCAKEKPAEIADQFQATILWMNEEPLVTSRQYTLQLGCKKTLCTVSKLKHQLDINNLNKVAASSIKLNEIGVCELSTVEAIAFEPYRMNQALGSFILIDRLSQQTIACGFIDFALRRANNIHYQPFHIGPTERRSIKGHKPCALWFTGISGAGKSAIANELELQLNQQNKHTVTLDGDNVRFGLCKDLGFTDSARCENIRRISEVSKLMVDAGLLTIISFISPFKAERDMAKELIGASQFIEIFIDTPLSIAEKRDVKGLYKKVRAGEIKNFTGIDSPYEKPLSPDIHIKTQYTSIKEAVAYILQQLVIKGVL